MGHVQWAESTSDSAWLKQMLTKQLLLTDRWVTFAFRSARGSSEGALQVVLLDSASIQVSPNQRPSVGTLGAERWFEPRLWSLTA